MNIDFDVKVTAKCDGCEKSIDLDNEFPYVYHQDCSNIYPLEIMKNVVEILLNNKQWEDYEHYIGFENEEEKKCYMYGIREGISHALFQLADQLGNDGILLWEKFTKESR